MRAILNGLAEAREDLPDLPKHVRHAVQNSRVRVLTAADVSNLQPVRFFVSQR